VESFRTLRHEAVQALVAAAAEATAAQALDDTPRMASSQHVIDVELRALNNLVAADEMLRRFGRELKEHEKTAAEDYSNGNGTSATEAAFERVAQFKRPKKDDGRSKTA
jgi:hypothetical protein